MLSTRFTQEFGIEQLLADGGSVHRETRRTGASFLQALRRSMAPMPRCGAESGGYPHPTARAAPRSLDA